MSVDDALNVIDQVLAGFKGTRQEHVTLVTAMQTVKDKVKQTSETKAGEAR